MMNHSNKYLFIILLLFKTSISYHAHGSEIRVAAWNIANLHHKENEEARTGIGTRRKAKDFEKLRTYVEKIDADIVALQEIGTKKGAERLFPPDEYDVFMSGRFQDNVAANKTDEIYTAIAVRKRPDIQVVKQEDVKDLSVIHVKDGVGRPTRQGTALLLNVSGTKLWILSVHLKSSCSTTRSADTSKKSDCKTFWKQRKPLKRWIDERQTEQIPFIIAGDFNRRFRQFDSRGPFWKHINGGDLDEPLLDKHPESVTRKCPTRKGKSTQPIDWILVDADIADWVVEGSFFETRFKQSDVKRHGGRKSQRLSDHCPIHVDLSF